MFNPNYSQFKQPPATSLPACAQALVSSSSLPVSAPLPASSSLPVVGEPNLPQSQVCNSGQSKVPAQAPIYGCSQAGNQLQTLPHSQTQSQIQAKAQIQVQSCAQTQVQISAHAQGQAGYNSACWDASHRQVSGKSVNHVQARYSKQNRVDSCHQSQLEKIPDAPSELMPTEVTELGVLRPGLVVYSGRGGTCAKLKSGGYRNQDYHPELAMPDADSGTDKLVQLGVTQLGVMHPSQVVHSSRGTPSYSEPQSCQTHQPNMAPTKAKVKQDEAKGSTAYKTSLATQAHQVSHGNLENRSNPANTANTTNTAKGANREPAAQSNKAMSHEKNKSGDRGYGKGKGIVLSASTNIANKREQSGKGGKSSRYPQSGKGKSGSYHNKEWHPELGLSSKKAADRTSEQVSSREDKNSPTKQSGSLVKVGLNRNSGINHSRYEIRPTGAQALVQPDGSLVVPANGFDVAAVSAEIATDADSSAISNVFKLSHFPLKTAKSCTSDSAHALSAPQASSTASKLGLDQDASGSLSSILFDDKSNTPHGLSRTLSQDQGLSLAHNENAPALVVMTKSNGGAVTGAGAENVQPGNSSLSIVIEIERDIVLEKQLLLGAKKRVKTFRQFAVLMRSMNEEELKFRSSKLTQEKLLWSRSSKYQAWLEKKHKFTQNLAPVSSLGFTVGSNGWLSTSPLQFGLSNDYVNLISHLWSKKNVKINTFSLHGVKLNFKVDLLGIKQPVYKLPQTKRSDSDSFDDKGDDSKINGAQDGASKGDGAANDVAADDLPESKSTPAKAQEAKDQAGKEQAGKEQAGKSSNQADEEYAAHEGMFLTNLPAFCRSLVLTFEQLMRAIELKVVTINSTPDLSLSGWLQPVDAFYDQGLALYQPHEESEFDAYLESQVGNECNDGTAGHERDADDESCEREQLACNEISYMQVTSSAYNPSEHEAHIPYIPQGPNWFELEGFYSPSIVDALLAYVNALYNFKNLAHILDRATYQESVWTLEPELVLVQECAPTVIALAASVNRATQEAQDVHLTPDLDPSLDPHTSYGPAYNVQAQACVSRDQVYTYPTHSPLAQDFKYHKTNAVHTADRSLSTPLSPPVPVVPLFSSALLSSKVPVAPGAALVQRAMSEAAFSRPQQPQTELNNLPSQHRVNMQHMHDAHYPQSISYAQSSGYISIRHQPPQPQEVNAGTLLKIEHIYQPESELLFKFHEVQRDALFENIQANSLLQERALLDGSPHVDKSTPQASCKTYKPGTSDLKWAKTQDNLTLKQELGDIRNESQLNGNWGAHSCDSGEPPKEASGKLNKYAGEHKGHSKEHSSKQNEDRTIQRLTSGGSDASYDWYSSWGAWNDVSFRLNHSPDWPYGQDQFRTKAQDKLAQQAKTMLLVDIGVFDQRILNIQPLNCGPRESVQLDIEAQLGNQVQTVQPVKVVVLQAQPSQFSLPHQAIQVSAMLDPQVKVAQLSLLGQTKSSLPNLNAQQSLTTQPSFHAQQNLASPAIQATQTVQTTKLAQFDKLKHHGDGMNDERARLNPTDEGTVVDALESGTMETGTEELILLMGLTAKVPIVYSNVSALNTSQTIGGATWDWNAGDKLTPISWEYLVENAMVASLTQARAWNDQLSLDEAQQQWISQPSLFSGYLPWQNVPVQPYFGDVKGQIARALLRSLQVHSCIEDKSKLSWPSLQLAVQSQSEQAQVKLIPIKAEPKEFVDIVKLLAQKNDAQAAAPQDAKPRKEIAPFLKSIDLDGDYPPNFKDMTLDERIAWTHKKQQEALQPVKIKLQGDWSIKLTKPNLERLSPIVAAKGAAKEQFLSQSNVLNLACLAQAAWNYSGLGLEHGAWAVANSVLGPQLVPRLQPAMLGLWLDATKGVTIPAVQTWLSNKDEVQARPALPSFVPLSPDQWFTPEASISQSPSALSAVENFPAAAWPAVFPQQPHQPHQSQPFSEQDAPGIWCLEEQTRQPLALAMQKLSWLQGTGLNKTPSELSDIHAASEADKDTLECSVSLSHGSGFEQNLSYVSELTGLITLTLAAEQPWNFETETLEPKTRAVNG